MLRLTKSSRGTHIHLSYRQKENLFNASFLKALAWAFLVHLLGLGLFHIQPFKFVSSYRFSPVTVQTNFNSTTLTRVIEAPHSEELTAPPFNVPELVPPFSFDPPLEWADFSTIEQRRSIPFPIEQVERKRVWMKISGSLADQKLLQFPSELHEHIHTRVDSDPIHLQYKVYIDERSGEVFWYELQHDPQALRAPKEITSQSETERKLSRIDDPRGFGTVSNAEVISLRALSHLAEKILLGLRFETSQQFEQLSGTIEFGIYGGLE